MKRSGNQFYPLFLDRICWPRKLLLILSRVISVNINYILRLMYSQFCAARCNAN